ncbi:MAG: hypothetical protein Q7J52_16200, partial [Falsiroseomonas sp.]|nr:hypothetical protein [Falsiroseomonas sp.]
MTSLIGHDAQARLLIGAAASGRMHHGWILSGPRGIGKGSFARALALRLDHLGGGGGVIGLGAQDRQQPVEIGAHQLAQVAKIRRPFDKGAAQGAAILAAQRIGIRAKAKIVDNRRARRALGMRQRRP